MNRGFHVGASLADARLTPPAFNPGVHKGRPYAYG